MGTPKFDQTRINIFYQLHEAMQLEYFTETNEFEVCQLLRESSPDAFNELTPSKVRLWRKHGKCPYPNEALHYMKALKTLGSKPFNEEEFANHWITCDEEVAIIPIYDVLRCLSSRKALLEMLKGDQNKAQK